MSSEGTKVVNYVDNEEFYREICEYRARVQAANAALVQKPRIPDCIAKKILLICERLSFARNFVIYGFREEMVSDAILNCVQRIDNFDPDISRSPFAYFTQLAWFAFVRRIQIEKGEKSTAIAYTVNTYLTELMDMTSDRLSDDGISDDMGVDISNRAARIFAADHVKTPKEEAGQVMKKKTTLAHQKRVAAREAKTPVGVGCFSEY